MTTITIDNDTTALGTGCPEEVSLKARYSKREVQLIKEIWVDTKVEAQAKVKLALDLLDLKTEMGREDHAPTAQGGRPCERFWAAFETGDLPQLGGNSRTRVAEYLQAAEFLRSGVLSGAPDKTLHALSPSTLCHLSRVKDAQALKLVEAHLTTHGFIGHDAASWLAAHAQEEKLIGWFRDFVKVNPTKPLVPSIIRNEVLAFNDYQKPAGDRTVEVKPPPVRTPVGIPAAKPWGETTYDGPPQRTAEELRQIRQEAAARGQRAEVKRTLQQSEQAEIDALKADQKAYSDALRDMLQSMQQLKTTVNRICARKGSLYLDELRELEGFMGLNYVTGDVAELQRAYLLLSQIVQFVTSREGPQTIDWETINVETT